MLTSSLGGSSIVWSCITAATFDEAAGWQWKNYCEQSNKTVSPSPDRKHRCIQTRKVEGHTNLVRRQISAERQNLQRCFWLVSATSYDNDAHQPSLPMTSFLFLRLNVPLTCWRFSCRINNEFFSRRRIVDHCCDMFTMFSRLTIVMMTWRKSAVMSVHSNGYAAKLIRQAVN